MCRVIHGGLLPLSRMTPDTPNADAMSPEMRRQLILAQTRILELEDETEALRTQLSEHRRLLAAAQSLADAKLEEAAHAAYHLRAAEATEASLRSREEQLQAAGERLAGLTEALASSRTAHAAETARREATEASHRAVFASRSWRWTGWLRAIERWLGRSGNK